MHRFRKGRARRRQHVRKGHSVRVGLAGTVPVPARPHPRHRRAARLGRVPDAQQRRLRAQRATRGDVPRLSSRHPGSRAAAAREMGRRAGSGGTVPSPCGASGRARPGARAHEPCRPVPTAGVARRAARWRSEKTAVRGDGQDGVGGRIPGARRRPVSRRSDGVADSIRRSLGAPTDTAVALAEPTDANRSAGGEADPMAPVRKRPTRYGLAIEFEERPGDLEPGRLVESTVFVNTAHPAYRRAVLSRSEGYHLALAVAFALAPLRGGQCTRAFLRHVVLGEMGRGRGGPARRRR